MAKDTEKLIRQLSLISFLMAQGRPVSALEIKREVEGYSDMNDDAFARRFYADRAELESLGIQLGVEKPGEGFFEAELYSLPPENFYLDPIEFADDELAALSTALSLLTDGGFAYAEPLRLALQQVAWGHPNPLSEGERAPVEMAMTASAGGRDLSQRLSKIETAISRRKTIEFTYYTMERDETEKRKVDPFHLRLPRRPVLPDRPLARARRGPRLPPLPHPGQGRLRVQGRARLLAARGLRPPRLRPARRLAARRDPQGTAKIFVRDRIAWLIERDFGAYGELRPAKKSDGAPGKGSVFETDYASPRELIAWVLRWRQNAEVLEPEELREGRSPRAARPAPRPSPQRLRAGRGRRPAAARGAAALALQRPRRGGDPPRALRPPRHPRRPADRLGEERRAAARRRPAPAASS